jgi:hypothetical protein
MIAGIALLLVMIRMPSLQLCRSERHTLWTTLLDDNNAATAAADAVMGDHLSSIPMNDMPSPREQAFSSPSHSRSQSELSVNHESGSVEELKDESSIQHVKVHQPKRPNGKPKRSQDPSLEPPTTTTDNTSSTFVDVAIVTDDTTISTSSLPDL